MEIFCFILFFARKLRENSDIEVEWKKKRARNRESETRKGLHGWIECQKVHADNDMLQFTLNRIFEKRSNRGKKREKNILIQWVTRKIRPPINIIDVIAKIHSFLWLKWLNFMIMFPILISFERNSFVSTFKLLCMHGHLCFVLFICSIEMLDVGIICLNLANNSKWHISES